VEAIGSFFAWLLNGLIDFLQWFFDCFIQGLLDIINLINWLGQCIVDGLVWLLSGFVDIVQWLGGHLWDAIMGLFWLLDQIGQWIFDGFVDLCGFFITLLDYLNPFSENFILWIAFVPDEGAIRVDVIQNVMNDKFGFFYSFANFISSFFNSFTAGTSPNFIVTMPAFLGGRSFNAIDFSFYNEYRNYIHFIIAGISYVTFIRKTIREIPKIIHR